jgi:hypothetical protein
MSDTFPAEEHGSGSRSTLTPTDRAFLESAPTHEEGEPPFSESPPLRSGPTPARRVSALLLFSVIAGSASLVLGLAVLRILAQALFP